jgi:hypothetical protein
LSERDPADVDSKQLRAIARKVLWWEPDDVAAKNPKRLACQVMAIGTWDDVLATRRILGDDLLRDALRDAPPGVFDARSWNYWHLVFGITPIPPLPARSIP